MFCHTEGQAIVCCAKSTFNNLYTIVFWSIRSIKRFSLRSIDASSRNLVPSADRFGVLTDVTNDLAYRQLKSFVAVIHNILARNQTRIFCLLWPYLTNAVPLNRQKEA